MNVDLIPAVDPAGLPAPPGVFHLLLVVTFVLHMLFLNLSLGGSLLAAVAHRLSGGRVDDYRAVLARRLQAVNTYGISLTITTGVAPLLFVQVLYGQLMYPATILLGWVWFALLILILVGYGAAWAAKPAADGAGRARGGWLLIAAVMFLAIAVLQVMVHLAKVQPELWPRLASSPWLPLGDPTFLPRLLHFVLAAVAFTALVVAAHAVRRVAAGVDPEPNRAIAAFAWRWALWTTALQVVDGFLLLLLLPRPVLLGLMRGGAATMVPLTLAILLGVGLLMMLARVTEPAARARLVTGTLAATVATVAVMAVTRHQIRELYLDPVADRLVAAVDPQWFNLTLFVVLLLAGLAVLAAVVRKVLTSPATGGEAA